ncbi:MAG: tRNA uridine-5-carboxymethylaminomethyl(34) synthesis GTPase MnmE [Nitrospira sp.]|nr:tRNA uridine-5-carboxymethylaminomethyl(34) synthesis GTPase MnmE [Nitrospira sp.]
MNGQDTICAISTPSGEGAIGMVRVSGQDAIRIAQQVFRKKPSGSLENLPSHTIHYGLVVDPATEKVLDEALLSILRKPRTYTREDMVEITCHGSPLLLTQVIALLLKSGARLAEPGEFTKRAFLNNRIDLTQAEAVMDIIQSKTDASLKVALGQLQGKLGREIKAAQDQLLSLLTHIEANIDFSEEGLQVISLEDMKKSLVQILALMRQLLEVWESGRILREGVAMAIVGRPNVGKSSLLNALLQQERAIVTSVPGTTRDVLEEWANIRGIAVKLIDTAGLRKTHDPIEQEGVRRAKEAIERSHLTLLVMDASQPIQDEDCDLMDLVEKKKRILVLNKVDLSQRIQEENIKKRLPDTSFVKISATKGIGLDHLQNMIRDEIFQGSVVIGETPLVVSYRHRAAIEKAHDAANRAILAIHNEMPSEFLALEIRMAINHLGEVIGTTTTDDLLDQIFSQFCIGK